MATSIYTPGGGWSPQGQQFNQGVNQQISIAQTKLASGQTLTPQESQALQDTYGQVAGESTRMQTSGARQQYIDQTNVSSMQSNYDDLARKLAGYDQMVLAPEFSNTNPGQPSDIPQSPDVSWGDISALTPEAAARPSGTGLYNSNPWYAMSSQIDQGNSLVNLLGTLNNTIGRETARGTNRYSSDLRALTSALDPLAQLMKLNSDYELEKMRISSSKSSAADEKWLVYAEKIKDDLQMGRYSAGNPLEAWGKAFKALKTAFPYKSDEEINAALGGRAYQDSSGNWTGEDNAGKDALIKFALNPTQFAGVNMLKSNLSNITQLRSLYNVAGAKGNPLLGAGAEGLNKVPGLKNLLSYTDPNAKQFISNRDAFITGLKSLVGESGVLTNQDVQRISSYLPTVGDKPVYANAQFDKAEQELKRTIARNQRTNIVMMSPSGKEAKQGNPDDQEVYSLIDKGWKVVDY